MILLTVPMESLKSWMLQVYELNMYDGDYAIIYITQQTTTDHFINSVSDESLWRNYDGDDYKRRLAFSNLFLVISSSL